MSKFEFNDYIIAIDEPYENDYGYVAIGKKQSNGINIVFGSPNEKTVNWFIELQKYITNLQSQLDQAKSEITKHKILLNDMETENSHLETMLDQANERLKGAIVPKFKVGQKVYHLVCNNGRDAIIAKDTITNIYRYDDLYALGKYRLLAKKSDLYVTHKEAEKKLQELRGGE